MTRACDKCGDEYEAKTARSRFCDVNCRTAFHKAEKAGVVQQLPPSPGAGPTGPPDDELIAPALRAEFDELGVLGLYEARTALRLARQLDSGVIVGAPFTSLSKELDRRVDALRLKAVRPDDPAAAVKERLAGKRLRLA